jgi:hypothetical protein
MNNLDGGACNSRVLEVPGPPNVRIIRETKLPKQLLELNIIFLLHFISFFNTLFIGLQS